MALSLFNILLWSLTSKDKASTSRPADKITIKPPTAFQPQIWEIMDKLRSSEANFKPPSLTQEQVDELERPLKGPEEERVNPDADQELMDVLLSAMIGQLTSKDVL